MRNPEASRPETPQPDREPDWGPMLKQAEAARRLNPGNGVSGRQEFNDFDLSSIRNKSLESGGTTLPAPAAATSATSAGESSSAKA